MFTKFLLTSITRLLLNLVQRYRCLGEYIGENLNLFFNKIGLSHQQTCTNTPQQNGLAERKNRHLLEVARALMFIKNVPKFYWGDAILTAAYLINHMPSRVLKGQSTVQLLSKKYPSAKIFSHLPPKIFGCVVYIHVSSQNRSKLDPRALKCIFLGYTHNQKGYKCYHPPTKKHFVTTDVTFFEHLAYYPKTDLQGERIPESEDSTWCLPCISTTDIRTETQMGQEKNPTVEEHIERVTSTPISKQRRGEETDRPELRVYSRRNRDIQEEQIEPIQDLPIQYINIEAESPKKQTPTELPAELYLPIAVRKGVRSCTQHPMSKFVSYQKLSHSYSTFTTNLSGIDIPSNIQEAVKDKKWVDAINDELRALHNNQTWELVKLPNGKKTVGCKWVFTVKFKADGLVERYKARLVAKGYTQTYGIDYQETFAPIAKINTIRILFSLVANFDWPLHQFDVKNAFLHGDLEEDVYMDIPPGVNVRDSKVYKLKKPLYGLKQSPKAWFEKFTRSMVKHGYHQSQGDHTLFMKHSSSGKVTILIVHVDDIIVIGDDSEEIKVLKQKLSEEFEIKDLGKLKYFLGIEVARSQKGIFISQRKYILDLLKEMGMSGCKPADTPIDPNVKLGIGDGESSDNRGQYQRLVRRLIYLSHTRPDIAFAVSLVSQFMHSPYEIHLEAVNRIIRYLKSSPGKGILYSKGNDLGVEAYTDSDWAGSIVDRRSTTGYCTFVGGNLVTWKSKKQMMVSRSSAEAKFRAMAQGICELLWI